MRLNAMVCDRMRTDADECDSMRTDAYMIMIMIMIYVINNIYRVSRIL